jgi:hypothetical protein
LQYSPFEFPWDPGSSVADPDPHQIERQDLHPSQSDKLDPDPHQVADDKPKCMEYEPI